MEQIRRRTAGKGKGKGKEEEKPIEVRGGLSRQVWHTPTELFKVSPEPREVSS